MRLLMNHGQAERYQHVELGFNGRMDSIQAAVLLAKLEVFEEEILARQQVAAWYDDILVSAGMRRPVKAEQGRSAYAQYTIEVDNRDQVRAQLSEGGIPTAVHYPTAIYQQAAVKPGAVRIVSSKESERAAAQVLSLPFHPYLTEAQVKEITDLVLKATGK
jgi:UDP-2-acetamido-2-deoxy-ribo-hexuluronate aminotransferase